MVKVRVTRGFAAGREGVISRTYDEYAANIRFVPPLEGDEDIPEADYYYGRDEFEVIDQGK